MASARKPLVHVGDRHRRRRPALLRISPDGAPGAHLLGHPPGTPFSQYFNFATALRQKWNISGDVFLRALLPLLGVPPWIVFASFSINLIYQFWIHTERIGKLWRPIEFVFNTPSHHRVHHGMDQQYLDKNYGGIFILWDRLFGSFQPETVRPNYGLTKQVDTYNIWRLQTHEYVAIARDVHGATRWRDKLGYIFGPPGWEPVQRRPVVEESAEVRT
jgi:Fatty acid hydroxylase superfamily